jgi:homoserine dehydrogenase
MMEQGRELDEVIRYAQSIGIAETDPSADVDGWDAAIKVAALITVLMGEPFPPQQVVREGIRGLSAEDIRAALDAGERWKLVCTARRENGQIHAQVAPQRVPSTSPLYSVGGTSSFVQFEMDTLSGLGILESNPGPDTTAYGLLADLLNALGKTNG